jgi:ADP-ribose pyrophosphatase YjhB (NUDIX family)
VRNRRRILVDTPTSNNISDGVEVAWRIEFPPRELPVRQVYGILFDEHDNVLVCNDRGRYNLPGGHPENGEDWLRTLERECIEEAQVEYVRPMYLGYVRVAETRDGVTEVYAQLRFVASIEAEANYYRQLADQAHSNGRVT